MQNKNFNELFHQSLQGLESLIDINKIMGNPFVIENKTIIPLAKISFGFSLGGSDLIKNSKNKKDDFFEFNEENYPFLGGIISGMNMIPEAFLIISDQSSEIITFNKEPDIFVKTLETISLILKKRK